MFGSSQFGQNNASFGTPSTSNVAKDFEVTSPPDDSISAMEFSPSTIQQNYLVAGSWDFTVSFRNEKSSKKKISILELQSI